MIIIKDNFKMVDIGCVYLFKSLPLNQWHPTLIDFEIAAAWLLNFGYETQESLLARAIFSRLNWDFDRFVYLFVLYHLNKYQFFV